MEFYIYFKKIEIRVKKKYKLEEINYYEPTNLFIHYLFVK